MVIEFDDIASLRNEYTHKKVVLTSGVFDLIHYGHVKYLQGLHAYGDIVVVAVRSDEAVRTNKHPTRPIIPDEDRVHMVDAIKGVDYAFVAPHSPTTKGVIDNTFETIFHELKPDVFVTSNDDWKAYTASIPCSLVIVSRSSGHFPSTTAIIEYIKTT